MSEKLYDHRTRWFGESWGAPVNDDDFKWPTPVGELCQDCRRAIAADDQGFLVYNHDYASSASTYKPWHRDCLIGSIIPEDVLQTVREVKKHGKKSV